MALIYKYLHIECFCVHRRETTPITTALAPPAPIAPTAPKEAPPRLVDVSNKLVRPKQPAKANAKKYCSCSMN